MTWLKQKLKDLSGWVYYELGGDLVELTRKANRLLTSDLLEPPDSDKDKRRAFLASMVSLYQNPELQWLLSKIADEQRTLSFEEARGLVSLEWGRATQNGLMLLKDALAKFATELADMDKKDEAFDPHQPL